MGGKQSVYRQALKKHQQRLKHTRSLFTDDVLSGDLVLISENLSTGLRSHDPDGPASHSIMNPTLLMGIQRSQLGKPMHLQKKEISGWTRTGIIVCDRLGDKFVLEATSAGVVSTPLVECVNKVEENGGFVALRQVEILDGRKFTRAILKVFESTKSGPFTWEKAKELNDKMAKGEKVELQDEMTARLCGAVVRNMQSSKNVLSVETKAQLDQMFSLYDRNGDGTIDEVRKICCTGVALLLLRFFVLWSH